MTLGPSNRVKGFLHFLSSIIVGILDDCPSDWCEMKSQRGFICISLIGEWCRTFFYLFVGHCIAFEKCLKFICPFINWIIRLFAVKFEFFVYSRYSSSVRRVARRFSPTPWVLSSHSQLFPLQYRSFLVDTVPFINSWHSLLGIRGPVEKVVACA